jgi:hypothetical protein
MPICEPGSPIGDAFDVTAWGNFLLLKLVTNHEMEGGEICEGQEGRGR